MHHTKEDKGSREVRRKTRTSVKNPGNVVTNGIKDNKAEEEPVAEAVITSDFVFNTLQN